MLPWSAQVAELTKLARLAPSPGMAGAPRAPGSEPALGGEPVLGPPALGPPALGARCLVCDAAPARPCAACGAVAYCGAAHQADDHRWHAPVCAALRAAGEDAAWFAEHGAGAASALARGVAPTELPGVGPARKRAAYPADWPAWLGRQPQAGAAADRVLTALASRPLTLGRLITELGLVDDAGGTLRVHVVGAAARELAVPATLWGELGRWFPALSLELELIGPELPAGVPAPFAGVEGLRGGVHRGLYAREWWDRLGAPHLVLAHNAGLLVYPTWERAVRAVLGTGVPLAITSFRAFEQAAELRLLTRAGARVVRPSAPNPFASRSPRRSTTLANDVTYDDAWVTVVA